MKHIFFYIIGLLVFSTFFCEGAGIVAWKDQSFHEDSMAKIATYSRRKLSGNEGVFNVNGKDIYLPANLHWCIDIPNSLPQELSDSTQYEMLLKQKYEMGVFRKRFPKSSAILDPWLKQLQKYQDTSKSTICRLLAEAVSSGHVRMIRPHGGVQKYHVAEFDAFMAFISIPSRKSV